MTETLEFYAVDNLDSKIVSFGTDGSKINSFSYDTWGFNGSIEASFTGKQLDSTGLYYFNARYYDPVIGRFLTEDPNKQGTSWYTYCSNNPINRIDPDGKDDDTVEKNKANAAKIRLEVLGYLVCDRFSDAHHGSSMGLSASGFSNLTKGLMGKSNKINMRDEVLAKYRYWGTLDPNDIPKLDLVLGWDSGMVKAWTTTMLNYPVEYLEVAFRSRAPGAWRYDGAIPTKSGQWGDEGPTPSDFRAAGFRIGVSFDVRDPYNPVGGIVTSDLDVAAARYNGENLLTTENPALRPIIEILDQGFHDFNTLYYKWPLIWHGDNNTGDVVLHNKKAMQTALDLNQLVLISRVYKGNVEWRIDTYGNYINGSTGIPGPHH